MRVILNDVDPADFVLAICAVKRLLRGDGASAVVAYGNDSVTKDFYVCRNKASVTVRRCHRSDCGEARLALAPSQQPEADRHEYGLRHFDGS